MKLYSTSATIKKQRQEGNPHLLLNDYCVAESDAAAKGKLLERIETHYPGHSIMALAVDEIPGSVIAWVRSAP